MLLNLPRTFVKVSSTLLALRAALTNQLLLRQVELVINNYCEFSAKTSAEYQYLTGKKIAIQLNELRMCWVVIFVGQHITIESTPETRLQPQAVDATLTIQPLDLGKRLFARPAGPLINSSGDFATLLFFKQFLLSLRLDWQRVLTQIFGGHIASLLIPFGSRMAHEVSQQLQRLSQSQSTSKPHNQSSYPSETM